MRARPCFVAAGALVLALAIAPDRIGDYLHAWIYPVVEAQVSEGNRCTSCSGEDQGPFGCLTCGGDGTIDAEDYCEWCGMLGRDHHCSPQLPK